MENVKNLYSSRGERKTPYIQISTTLTAETIEQINNFKKDVSEYCDYYNIGYTSLNHLNVDSMNISAEEKIKIKKLQQQEKLNHVYTSICPEAFDKLSVNWNGDVTLCCSDYDNYMVVGNILDNDLKELFNSKAAYQYRKVVAEKQYGKIKCCSTCYSYIPLTN